MSLRRRRKGLTLLELVVALTVAAAAVSAGYAALAGLVDRRDALLTSTEEASHAAAARATIIGWLDGTLLDPVRIGASFRGLDGSRDARPDDELTFLTGSRTPLDVSRTLVTLRIDRDSAGRPRGLVAELRDWNGAARRTILLSPAAGALDARYRSGLANEEVWISSWITGSVLPVGVELRVAGSGIDSLHALLRLPILVPLQAGR